MNQDWQENRQDVESGPSSFKKTPSHILNSNVETHSTTANLVKPREVSDSRKNILKNKQEFVPAASGQRGKNTLMYPSSSHFQKPLEDNAPSKIGAKYTSIEKPPAPLKEILKNQSSPGKITQSGKKSKTIGFNLPDSNQDSYESPKKEDNKSISSDPPRAPVEDLPEPKVNEQQFHTGEN